MACSIAPGLGVIDAPSGQRKELTGASSRLTRLPVPELSPRPLTRQRWRRGIVSFRDPQRVICDR